MMIRFRPSFVCRRDIANATKSKPIPINDKVPNMKRSKPVLHALGHFTSVQYVEQAKHFAHVEVREKHSDDIQTASIVADRPLPLPYYARPSLTENCTLSLPVLPLTTDNLTWKQRLALYKELSKFKLSTLVVSTTVAGFLMAPLDNAFLIVDPIIGNNFDWSSMFQRLAATTIGTALCTASACAMNQISERAQDAAMKRTWKRPLPRGAMTLQAANTFAWTCAVSGPALLALTVNPMTAVLGATNIILYAFIYTPLKRITIHNTLIGAIVGAVPPLMGWTAVVPVLHDPAAYVLPAVLFAWQLPHFFALSWRLRADYARAGYVMACTVRPLHATRACLGWSLALIPATGAAYFYGLTTTLFLLDGGALSTVMIYLSYQFWSSRGGMMEAKRLFRWTLLFLPLYMTLMLVHKQCHKEKSDLK